MAATPAGGAATAVTIAADALTRRLKLAAVEANTAAATAGATASLASDLVGTLARAGAGNCEAAIADAKLNAGLGR